MKMNRNQLQSLSYKVGVPIQKLSKNVIDQIKAAPQAQKRTSQFKKAVYVVDNQVYKGPYVCDDHKLLKNLSYTFALHVLEEALELPLWRRAALQWTCIGFSVDDQCYLVAPNVGKHWDIPFVLLTTKLEGNVQVVPRGGFVSRVSDVEKNGQLTDDIKLAALQHLYLRFLLGIGDSGTHNILIRQNSNHTGRLVAGIDLEEQRKKVEKNSRLDHLFKKSPSKLQEKLYKPYVGQIVLLNTGLLDQSTSDQLSAVGIDSNRLRMNTETWEALD